MILCVHADCDGHDDRLDAIHHGQHELYRLLTAIGQELGRIRPILTRIEIKETHTMSAVDDLVTVAAAAVDALDKLEALVQAGQLDNPQVVQVVNDLRAAVDQAATIDGDNPPAPPVEPTV